MSEPNKIGVLPIWKRDASLAERLEEVAGYSRAKPERFTMFAMAYMEKLPNGNLKFRILSHGADLTQLIGLFEIGKIEAHKDSER